MAENWFSLLPEKQILIKDFGKTPGIKIPEVNGHIHTPFSFSAFTEIKQVFFLAKESGVDVLGINDFYTTEGYSEFALAAVENKIFPLFNIEFMALQKDLLLNGIRVNDPANPGRTYLCGKGLNFPLTMSSEKLNTLENLQKESNRHTCRMVEKLNFFLGHEEINLHFDADEIRQRFAKYLFRERHIAQAIRSAIFENFAGEEERKTIIKKLFRGKELKSELTNIAELENEIRSNLLRAGSPAFIEEDPKAFLSLDEVISIILDAGGIPCYPVLLDDPQGKFTEFESDRLSLFQSLNEKNICMIELIPGRNNFNILKDFVTWFHKKGFVIIFGTEHNTPQLDPIKVSCRENIPLDDELRKINYEGAAILAAHQYLQASGEQGFLENGIPRRNNRQEFIELGKAVIANFTGK